MESCESVKYRMDSLPGVDRLRIRDLGVKDPVEVAFLKAPVELRIHRTKTKVFTLTFLLSEGLEALKTILAMRQAKWCRR